MSSLSILPEMLTTTLSAAAVTAAAAIFARRFLRPVLMEQSDIRKKKQALVKDLIKKKFANNIAISSHDILDIGRGSDVPQALAIEALYQLFAEAEDEESYSKIKKLIEELQKEEPFESLPDETRPSLARLATLCDESGQNSDRELLHPITKILSEYMELKQERATLKRQGRISYAIAIVSFFIGVVGLILAFTGPSKDFIEKQLENSKQEILNELRGPTIR
jgi:hypothetical protein